MSKKNFIPLCMMPFIANMMSDREDSGIEPEPELPYYVLKRFDIGDNYLFKPNESGIETLNVIIDQYDALLVSDSLKAAIVAGKDILIPEDYTEDDSNSFPEGYADSAEWLDHVDTQMKAKYPDADFNLVDGNETYFVGAAMMLTECAGKILTKDPETGYYGIDDAKFEFVEEDNEYGKYMWISKKGGK